MCLGQSPVLFLHPSTPQIGLRFKKKSGLIFSLSITMFSALSNIPIFWVVDRRQNSYLCIRTGERFYFRLPHPSLLQFHKSFLTRARGQSPHGTGEPDRWLPLFTAPPQARVTCPWLRTGPSVRFRRTLVLPWTLVPMSICFHLLTPLPRHVTSGHQWRILPDIQSEIMSSAIGIP